MISRFAKIKTKLFLLTYVMAMLLVGCSKDDSNNNAEQKGWIIYDNKTYALTQAASVSQQIPDAEFTGTEFVFRLANEMREQAKATSLIFGFYSETSSLQTVSGTYTKRHETPTLRTISNQRHNILLSGSSNSWPEIIHDENIKIEYTNGLYQIEGFFILDEGKLEFYYKGEIDIQ